FSVRGILHPLLVFLGFCKRVTLTNERIVDLFLMGKVAAWCQYDEKLVGSSVGQNVSALHASRNRWNDVVLHGMDTFLVDRCVFRWWFFLEGGGQFFCSASVKAGGQPPA